MEELITAIISALTAGGGGVWLGVKVLKKKPNGSSNCSDNSISREEHNACKKSNTAEHKELFEITSEIKRDTAVLIERTKNM